MTISQQNWINYLNQVAPSSNETPHSWICSVRRGGFCAPREYEVLTQEEYEAASRIHYCDKLSLNDIVAISYRVFHPKNSAAQEKIALLSCGNIFEASAEEEIAEFRDKVRAAEAPLRNLEKMSARSTYKRTAEKASGIWGYIKWHIWSWFFDTSSTIAALRRATVKSLQDGIDGLKERLYINMDWFCEIVEKKPIEKRAFSLFMTLDTDSPDFIDKFGTPSKVRKNWLRLFTQDRIPDDTISSDAVTARQRIILALRIWSILTKEDAPPEDSGDRGESSGPLQLEGV